VCFRPCEAEATTSVTSLCGKPDTQVITSGSEDEIPTQLHLEAPQLITRELLADMTSITYQPNPLTVSAIVKFSICYIPTVIISQ